MPVSISPELKKEFNDLARTLYMLQGYQGPEDYDFSNSSHPTERLMYHMAVAAYDHFNHNGTLHDDAENYEIENFEIQIAKVSKPSGETPTFLRWDVMAKALMKSPWIASIFEGGRLIEKIQLDFQEGGITIFPSKKWEDRLKEIIEKEETEEKKEEIKL